MLSDGGAQSGDDAFEDEDDWEGRGEMMDLAVEDPPQVSPPVVAQDGAVATGDVSPSEGEAALEEEEHIDLTGKERVPNDGAGQCALFSIDQAERGTAESDETRAQQLRNELAQFYIREQRNPSRISGMTWEEFVLSDPDNRQNKQYGFAIATWAQYIASIRTRGTYIGLPELDALARLRSRYIVVVDPSGKVQTRHGDPAHEHILLRYALSHYELMRPQVRHLSHIKQRP